MAVVALAYLLIAAAPQPLRAVRYIGFDRNVYPGDEALAKLRNIFRFTSYWLNNPPGENANTWAGKRALLKSRGFGFLVLFNGCSFEQLKAPNDAAALVRLTAMQQSTARHVKGFRYTR